METQNRKPVDAAAVAALRYVMEHGVESFGSLLEVRTEWNWSCCQSCGESELRQEFESGESDQAGYAFCHSQDVAGISGRGGCYVAYGSFDPAVEPAVVGRQVVEALQAVGLVVAWSGKASERILVRLDSLGSSEAAAVEVA
jgi:hypothetical protein